jgi:phosphotransferase system  glucose/maltose/N-acetylglucosamine-specific IIC component
MVMKGLAVFVVLAAMMQTPVSALAQAPSHPSASSEKTQTAPAIPSSSAFPMRPECNGGPCEDQVPRTITVQPPPAPIVWTTHERILWGAYLILAILGYAGIMLAITTLKKIERQTRIADDTATAAFTAANAAAEAAQAALLHAQAIAKAERPWVLVTAEPTRGVESSFEITATNRGRSPANITSALDVVLFAADEAHLSDLPDFAPSASGARFVPIILLPGESATLKSFSREDVKVLCDSEEKFKSIESWEERIFLCGKVIYNDLITPAGKGSHESTWCLWYIHGKQRSALVPAGPAEYNSHT